MDLKTLLIELVLSGFFAVCCIRAHTPTDPEPSRTVGDFFRLAGRVERLRRSRWQWFSMVAFMLVLRLQQQLPPIMELMAAFEFALFMALPKGSDSAARVKVR